MKKWMRWLLYVLVVGTLFVMVLFNFQQAQIPNEPVEPVLDVLLEEEHIIYEKTLNILKDGPFPVFDEMRETQRQDGKTYEGIVYLQSSQLNEATNTYRALYKGKLFLVTQDPLEK